jgi:2-oxoglutarate dehydrogenase E1 component
MSTPPVPGSASPPFFSAGDKATSQVQRRPPTLDTQNLIFAESQYDLYLRDRNSVSPDWRHYFDELHALGDASSSPRPAGPFQPQSLFHKPMVPTASGEAPSTDNQIAVFQERIDQLIRNYRVRGHHAASIDPLQHQRPIPAELDPAFYGFSDDHMQMEFSTQWFGGPEYRSLRDILDWLQRTYCQSIGVQFMHIDSLQVRSWLQDRMERRGNSIRLSRDEQIRILTRLSDAVMFEEFVQKKYVGAKSFSLEGAESLIPLLDLAIEQAGQQGVELIVLGMAHRGRLNVLANIMGKKPSRIFREFEDCDPQEQMGRGDVKYHLGYSSNWQTSAGRDIHLTLCFNPSHLEFVNPVALGRLRAKQDLAGDLERRRSCTFLIHGDAAFAGEGIVQETLNMSELPGYQTGGTIHIIVNNQIGFTTSPSEGRSCTYATDVARMLQIPIFHVNGEDPEAVAQVVRLAMDFRARFQRDVIIDMYCFRRRGHNEGDEPAFTQPVMYRSIRSRDTVYERYRDSLLTMGGVTREEADEIAERRSQVLENELAAARASGFKFLQDTGGGRWKNFFGGPYEDADVVTTTIDPDELQGIVTALNTPPADFKPHPRVQRIIDQRLEMGRGERPYDWGAAEMAAFGTLVSSGVRLRFSGQDVRRGTFSHRHATLFDSSNGLAWTGLQSLAAAPEMVEIYNSPLSEAGVLGFEYGYSLDFPDGLVIWEAQFGDFVNAAQVIIDQFICSAEDKWRRLSGLVMLLPHGFEGQGPEHSSARLERFLMLAAEDNIQITNPTTPAQYFHMLRRHTLRRWKKPLVVMTPKSLLRHKDAVSTQHQLCDGQFHEVLEDPAQPPASEVRRVLICSGKIFYDLNAYRREHDRQDVAIVRLEQLYPFPGKYLAEVLNGYKPDTEVVWVQEEPRNMGAWPFLRTHYGETLPGGFRFRGITRAESASPATGSGTSHKIEQQIIIDHAFEIE